MKTRHTPRLSFFLFLALGASAAVPSGWAATETWNNASGTAWNNAANWSPSSAFPNGSADTALFSNSTLIPSTLSLGQNIQLQLLRINASTARSLTLDGGGTEVNTLTLTGSGAYANALYVQGAANSLTLAADVVFDNAGGTAKSTQIEVENGSSVTLAAGNKVSILNATSLDLTSTTGGTLNFNADFDVSGSASALLIDGGTVNWNVGTFTVTSAAATLIQVRGNTSAATVNFQKSFQPASGSILIGPSTGANATDAVYGTANNVTISANIGMNGGGTGGAASNFVILGANDTSATAGAPTTVTFSGNQTIFDNGNARTHQFFAAANNTAVFSGAIGQSGTVSGSVFQKTGSGTVTFSGTTANTYNSSITMEVMAGTLLLQKTAGVAALTGAARVDSGATLALGASNQIADSAGLTLAGGTFAPGSFAETLGTLSLTGSSTLSLASGGALLFANSSAIDWAGFILSVSGTGGSLRFGTSASGLTTAQLADIVFTGYGNAAAQIDANGYVTAVPEPRAAALVGMGLAALAGYARLRKRAGASPAS